MFEIKINTDTNFKSIISIAKEVWPITYGSILSTEQLDYMMEMMYSIPSLQEQVNNNKHHFIVATLDNLDIGFASYELNYTNLPICKIHKLYFLTAFQKKGFGEQLIQFIEEVSKKNNHLSITLNVNRNNNAQYFYKKLGFSIDKEEDIDIGNGYLMEDYVMQKIL